MREIKFRAWIEEYKKFNYYYLLMINDIKALAEMDWNYEDLMQYTGLKDKNGKEIYEGDIVEYVEHHSLELDCQQVFVVAFANGGFFLSSLEDGEYDDDINISPVEVIGNKYENPELLK